LIPALAATTSHVGFVATISTTYNQPYELARQLASIDEVTGGRLGWNVVTSFSNSLAEDSGGDQIAYNFSKEKHLAHATRYDRAREFVTLIKRLWDSWAPRAIVNDTVDPSQVYPSTIKAHGLRSKDHSMCHVRPKPPGDCTGRTIRRWS
jgi:alkanesulfonate monooxygenase SsuD/methylene tetrahydromethanopterin reductase-like flavin-dependent oxidoreductase (luciferase family)